MDITCKVMLQEGAVPGAESTQLVFVPDYADERNKEWAYYTPSLHFAMTVRNEVAEEFLKHGKYTVTFSPTEE